MVHATPNGVKLTMVYDIPENCCNLQHAAVAFIKQGL